MPTVAEKVDAVVEETRCLRQAIRDTNSKNSHLHHRVSILQAELDSVEHAMEAEVSRAMRLDDAVGASRRQPRRPEFSASHLPPRTSVPLSDDLRQAIAAAGEDLETAHQAWVDLSARRTRTEAALKKQLAVNEVAAARVKSREKQIHAAVKEANAAARILREREKELAELKEARSEILAQMDAIDRRAKTLSERKSAAEADARQHFSRRTQSKEMVDAEAEAAERRQKQIDALRRENRSLIQRLLRRNVPIASVSVGDPLLRPAAQTPSSLAFGRQHPVPNGAASPEAVDAAASDAAPSLEERARRETEEALLRTMEQLIHSVASRASGARTAL
jgi:hypothetical protein